MQKYKYFLETSNGIDVTNTEHMVWCDFYEFTA